MKCIILNKNEGEQYNPPPEGSYRVAVWGDNKKSFHGAAKNKDRSWSQCMYSKADKEGTVIKLTREIGGITVRASDPRDAENVGWKIFVGFYQVIPLSIINKTLKKY